MVWRLFVVSGTREIFIKDAGKSKRTYWRMKTTCVFLYQMMMEFVLRD